jgi:hypothetical protein
MLNGDSGITPEEKESLTRLYIALGMAMHIAQLVEKELALVLLFPTHSAAKRRPTADEIAKTKEAVDRMTFGQLLRRLKRVATISPEFQQHLDEGLRKRNYLIHHFFDFYGADMCIPSIREKMIAELDNIHRLLHPLYQKFSELSYESFKAWGMTDDQIQRKIGQLETDFKLRRKNI